MTFRCLCGAFFPKSRDRTALVKCARCGATWSPKKHPDRVAGGHARSASLSSERRSEIAQHAARIRWAKQEDTE